MDKQFNTAGPSKSDLNYVLDPLARFNLGELEELIDAQRYFVLHAPRQTGKTTALLALMQRLNQQGRYRALYANIETAQAARGQVERGIAAATSAVARSAAVYLQDKRLDDWLLRGEGRSVAAEEQFFRLLAYWTELDPAHPTILLLDEVDALVGDTLISLLRQIRAGYAQRPGAFPQTVILCGVRDVRDYRIHSGSGEIITGGSAFNIKAASLRLGNFSPEECVALWRQHEAATGQLFDQRIWSELWADTEGQPWLVNALGHELTWHDKTLRNDRSLAITLEHYRAARERLIESRATHLDQLVDKLREPRVHSVIAAILSAEADDTGTRQEALPSDDLQYVHDLGLVAVHPMVRIANRIYQEVIPRELTWTTQVFITHETPWYVRQDDRRLDTPKLLSAFQQFFREHSDAWIEGFSYKEAGPQLLLQAFLQRIVNGGGRIGREYALGRKRTDLLIEWPLDQALGYHGPVQRIVIECKLIRKGEPETVLPLALQQTADYAAQVGAEEAALILFDRRGQLDWDARCWQRQAQHAGRSIGVWGM